MDVLHDTNAAMGAHEAEEDAALAEALADWNEDEFDIDHHHQQQQQLEEHSTSSAAAKEAASINLLTCLPKELLLRACAFLSAEDLARASMACTQFRQLCEEQVLWRRLFCARWGKPQERQEGASWKYLYQHKDLEEHRAMEHSLRGAGGGAGGGGAGGGGGAAAGDDLMRRLYMDMQRARRQQTLGRGQVDDQMEVPLGALQEQLAAWRRQYPPVLAGQPPRVYQHQHQHQHQHQGARKPQPRKHHQQAAATSGLQPAPSPPPPPPSGRHVPATDASAVHAHTTCAERSARQRAWHAAQPQLPDPQQQPVEPSAPAPAPPRKWHQPRRRALPCSSSSADTSSVAAAAAAGVTVHPGAVLAPGQISTSLLPLVPAGPSNISPSPSPPPPTLSPFSGLLAPPGPVMSPPQHLLPTACPTLSGSSACSSQTLLGQEQQQGHTQHQHQPSGPTAPPPPCADTSASQQQPPGSSALATTVLHPLPPPPQSALELQQQQQQQQQGQKDQQHEQQHEQQHIQNQQQQQQQEKHHRHHTHQPGLLSPHPHLHTHNQQPPRPSHRHRHHRTPDDSQQACRPPLELQGRHAFTWDQIGGRYFGCREYGWLHLCDDTCGEGVIDPAHDLVVCPISGRSVERMLSEWDLRVLARQRTGPVGHDEAAHDFAGMMGRAYERGYECRNDRELEVRCGVRLR